MDIFEKVERSYMQDGEAPEIVMFIISIQRREIQCWITCPKISIRNLGNHVKLFGSFRFEPGPFDKSTGLSRRIFNILSYFGKKLFPFNSSQEVLLNK